MAGYGATTRFASGCARARLSYVASSLNRAKPDAHPAVDLFGLHKEPKTIPVGILIQRLARFATLFVVDEGAFDQGAHSRRPPGKLAAHSVVSYALGMYRNQHRATKLRALSDVLEYGGVARNQEAATATLGGLMHHARTLQALQDALTGTLPPAMSQGCRVANLNGDTISVLCNHPSLGARLRQMGPSLINAWRQAGFACSALDVRIRPGLPEDKKPAPFQRPPLSAEVATTLSALENEISDAGLKAALARLRQSAQ